MTTIRKHDQHSTFAKSDNGYRRRSTRRAAIARKAAFLLARG